MRRAKPRLSPQGRARPGEKSVGALAWLRFGCLCSLVAGCGLSGAALDLAPEQAAQIQAVYGSRIESIAILGGDYTAASGSYTFEGVNDASMEITKVGGGGGLRQPQPLGSTGLKWSPAIAGNLGLTSARNLFRTGPIAGNEIRYRMWAAQLGAGLRLMLSDRCWVNPMINGIYGRVENDFQANTSLGRMLEAPAKEAGLVDWNATTWSVEPSLELHYLWNTRRIAWEFTSRYNYFQTEDLWSSSPLVKVDARSSTWQNKIDADVPLGVRVWGRELHTGGYLSRSELYGDLRQGFPSEHINAVSGRLVLADIGTVFRYKVRWLGIAATRYWGTNFEGWSAGLTMRLSL